MHILATSADVYGTLAASGRGQFCTCNNNRPYCCEKLPIRYSS